MFRKFKGLMALFAIICVIAIAGGSAYFYFGGYEKDRVIENTTDDNEVKTDNILENYEFGSDKDLNETYTYYFFPSTLYMSDTFYSQTVKPETVFGYNEVILDDNGDPVLDSNNQPQYKIVQDGRTGINNYSTYHEYLTNYLNYESESYLNSNPLALSMDDQGGNKTPYSYSNKGANPSTQNNTNGNVFHYGVGFDGNDYHVQGYDVSIADPYILNNKNFSMLTANLNIGNNYRGPVKQATGESWGDNYFYYLKGEYNKIINYENEILSPVIEDENYDISLSLTDEKKANLDNFAYFYQHGLNSRINGAYLKVTSENGLRYDHSRGSYRDKLNEDLNIVDHSPFYYDYGLEPIQSFSIADIKDNPELGTWFAYSDDRDLVTLTFLSNNQGYIADSGGTSRTNFTYQKTDSIITISKRNPVDGDLKIIVSDPTNQW